MLVTEKRNVLPLEIAPIDPSPPEKNVLLQFEFRVGDHQSLTAQSLNGVHSVASPEGGDKVTTRSATTSTTTTQPRNKSLSRRARIHYRIG
jgi:hypothetical protein